MRRISGSVLPILSAPRTVRTARQTAFDAVMMRREFVEEMYGTTAFTEING